MPATVGTYPCLGGCGRELDPEAYPDGLCRDCEREYGEPDPPDPKPGEPGYKRRSD